MNKEEVLKLIEEHQDSYPQIIKTYHGDFYNKIINLYIGEKFGEKLYRWIHEGENFGKCLNCEKETKFQSFIIGFKKYCSKKCSNISTAGVRSKTLTHKVPDPLFWIETSCKKCGKLFWSLIKRNQLFCSNGCSTNFTANNEERLRKIKETKLERYGDETFVNSEKAKETCIERYGVDNASKSDIIKQKIIESNREIYGVDYSCQNEEIKEKIKNTNLERYGVENASSSQIVKDKRENTFINRYGVKNPFQLSEIKLKSISTNLNKYSAEYWFKNSELRNKADVKYKITIYNKNKIRYDSIVEFLFNESDFKGIDKQYVYDFRCKKCNNLFKDHMDGNGHPRCLICYPPIQKSSYDEMEILEFIKFILKPNEIIEDKNRKILNGLELDIYIPALKLAIEFDGLFWHSEMGGKKNKNYHLNKTEECEKLGIRLIHIFEDEWINNKEIVKNRLKYILKNINAKSIYARNCEIKEISFIECNNFLNKTHLQGGCNSSIHVGLFFEDGLVSVMSFGKLRLALGNKILNENEYELLRYATSGQIVGGASKLLSYFVKTYKPKKIISYADRRWSDGNLYKKIGFNLVRHTDISYYYFKPGYAIRYHRFGFRKNILSKKLVLFDPQLTEWQNMQLNGYDRIWDCGNLKYEMVF